MGRKRLPPAGSLARVRLDQQRDRPIAEYVLGRLPAQPKRGAREQAISAAADHFGVDRTTVQRALRRYKAAAPLREAERAAEKRFAPMRRFERALEPGRRIAEALKLISTYVTSAELEEMGAVSLATILKIALDRRAARRLPQPARKVSGSK